MHIPSLMIRSAGIMTSSLRAIAAQILRAFVTSEHRSPFCRIMLAQAVRVAVMVFSAILAGCAGVAPVPYSAVASSSYMTPNPSNDSGRVPYRYATTVDWRSYNRAILEPIVIYRGPDQQFGDLSEQDKAALAAYMQTRFAERLARRFALVNQRGPNTLRVRLTLTGAVANTPVLGTLSRFDLAGAVYNGVQAARDREGR